MPQERAAAVRSVPSSTRASASMRRAAAMLAALEEAARNSSAVRSLRVIAIPAMARSPDPPTEPEAKPSRTPPSQPHRPLVLEVAIHERGQRLFARSASAAQRAVTLLLLALGRAALPLMLIVLRPLCLAPFFQRTGVGGAL